MYYFTQKELELLLWDSSQAALDSVCELMDDGTQEEMLNGISETILKKLKPYRATRKAVRNAATANG